MMTEAVKQQLLRAGRPDLVAQAAVNDSGYAGVLPNGKLVDRRLYPEAYPVPENRLLGIPAAKALPKINLDENQA